MRIALDSNVLIAALVSHETTSQQAQRLILDLIAGKHRAVASSIIYGEVIGISVARLDDLENFFGSLRNMVTIPADDGTCLAAAEFRRKHGNALKLPDALHIATAQLSGAEVFITNDKKLAQVARKLVPTKTLADWA